jgi:hypothetical protein
MITAESRSPLERSERRARLILSAGAALTIAILGNSYLFADTPSGGSTSMTTTNAESSDRAATMNAATKADAFREVLKAMGGGGKIDPRLWNTFVAAQNDGLRTGPRIGEKVPDFTLPDQNGKPWTLH